MQLKSKEMPNNVLLRSVRTLILLLLLPLYAVANEDCIGFFQKFSSERGIEIEACVWNNDQTAVAVCGNNTSTKCYISDSENTVDVSNIQLSNIGKLGVSDMHEYESISTEKKWISSEGTSYLVSFQTRVWLKGQRYTVSGPVAVVNGKYHGQ